MSAVPEPLEPKSWSEWYRFAQEELGFQHDECVEYANLRYVEEENRASLRRSGRGPAEASPAHSHPELHPG